jgi:hypothetical protein
VEHVVQRPTIWAVLPPVAALSDLGPDRRGVPSPCHAGRALAASDGHSRSLESLWACAHSARGAGPHQSWGWVEGWISPCGARPTDPVPGCGGPERWRRPRPDGTGATPKASAGSSATSGPRASGRQRTATVTRGLPSWLVNCLAGLSLQAVGTIDSLPYNPVDHARMRSPLPARAAVGRQQRAIWAQAWSVSSWRLPPVLLGRLSAGQPKPTNQASSAGPSRAGIISASYRSG